MIQNNIKRAAGAGVLALCALSAFFCKKLEAHADTSAVVQHRHSGSAEDGSGCYKGLATVEWECHSYNLDRWFYAGSYTYLCRDCGTTFRYQYDIDGAQCNGSGVREYYVPNCGKTGAKAVTFSCGKSTDDWAQELDLNASYNIHDAGVQVTGYLWNGHTGDSSYHVTSNGTYTLQLTGNGDADFSTSVSVTVDRIDRTAPVIESFGASPDQWGSSLRLSVAASDGESGLAAQAYSFDGGTSWSSENTYTVTANGDYSVSVRDAAGNISTAQTTVSRIDSTPPQISVSMSPSPDQWYDGELTVVVHAEDAESGLADAPYSFDGGATYLVGNCYTLFGSTTLEIAVVDRAGNISRYSVGVEKKVRPAPTLSPEAGAGSGGGNGAQSGTGIAGTGGGAGAGGGSGAETDAGSAGSGDSAGAGESGGAETDAGIAGAGGATESGEAETGAGIAGTGGGAGAGGTGGAQTGTGSGGTATPGGSTGSGRSGGGSGSTGRGGTGTPGGSGQNGGADTGRGEYAESRAQADSGDEETASPGAGKTNPWKRESDRSWREIMPVQGQDGQNLQGQTEGMISEEEAAVQNELFAAQNELEAATLERGKTPVPGRAPIGTGWITKIGLLAVGGAIVLAALSAGWVWLFGVRVYTKDAEGRYRIAGITRVMKKGNDKQKVVPLTKQIIRNSVTNDLCLRFAGPVLSRYEGESLLLVYKTMRREFTAQREVRLRMHA